MDLLFKLSVSAVILGVIIIAVGSLTCCMTKRANKIESVVFYLGISVMICGGCGLSVIELVKIWSS